MIIEYITIIICTLCSSVCVLVWLRACMRSCVTDIVCDNSRCTCGAMRELGNIWKLKREKLIKSPNSSKQVINSPTNSKIICHRHPHHHHCHCRRCRSHRRRLRSRHNRIADYPRQHYHHHSSHMINGNWNDERKCCLVDASVSLRRIVCLMICYLCGYFFLFLRKHILCKLSEWFTRKTKI